MSRPSLIVDGMNVIGSRPDGWWRDRRAAMASLADRLGALAAADGEEVIVVFDGRPFDVAQPDAGSEGSVEVVFASRRGRDAADDDIVALVERSEDPAALRVATSDRGLAARVRAFGAEVTGARELRRRLDAL